MGKNDLVKCFEASLEEGMLQLDRFIGSLFIEEIKTYDNEALHSMIDYAPFEGLDPENDSEKIKTPTGYKTSEG